MKDINRSYEFYLRLKEFSEKIKQRVNNLAEKILSDERCDDKMKFNIILKSERYGSGVPNDYGKIMGDIISRHERYETFNIYEVFSDRYIRKSFGSFEDTKIVHEYLGIDITLEEYEKFSVCDYTLNDFMVFVRDVIDNGVSNFTYDW